MLNHAIQTNIRKRTLDTPVQKRILQALAALADEHGEINRSLPEIAHQAQACRRTVIQVLHELAAQEEILILNAPRKKGHYRINHLPTEAHPPVDSLRTPIVEAIRLLPLSVRVSVIYQALAQYASRTGNNMFPSVTTLMRDTGYSQSTIQETLRWLLKANFIAPDRECVTPTYQTRIGYKIPGWHPLAQILTIDEEQIAQIKALYDHHNRGYQKQKAEKLTRKHSAANQGEEEGNGKEQTPQEEEVSWWEDRCMDLEECQQGASTWRPEEEEDQEEQMEGEESAGAAEDRVAARPDGQGEELVVETVPEDLVVAPAVGGAAQGSESAPGRSQPAERVAAGQDVQQDAHDQQGEERVSRSAPLSFLRPEPLVPSERIRVRLAPERRNTAVSLRSYQTARAEMESHLRIIEEHKSGRAPVDAATLKKSQQIVSFYQRTIAAYEEHCQRRE